MKNKISDLSKVELVFSPSSFASGISSATTNPTSNLPGETVAEAFIHPEVWQTESLSMSLDKLIVHFKNFLVAEIELTILGAHSGNGTYKYGKHQKKSIERELRYYQAATLKRPLRHRQAINSLGSL